MVIIVEKPAKYRIECKNCNSLLEFERIDILHTEIGYKQSMIYIKCPHCTKDVDIQSHLDTLKVTN